MPVGVLGWTSDVRWWTVVGEIVRAEEQDESVTRSGPGGPPVHLQRWNADV